MSETYERDSFLATYARWHYGRGLREFFGIVENFLWFVTHFFSLHLLLNTLFEPWKTLGQNLEGGLGAKISLLIVNHGLMRLAGFLSRTVIILTGLTAYFIVLFVSFLVFVIWLFAPLVVLGSLVLAVTFFAI